MGELLFSLVSEMRDNPGHIFPEGLSAESFNDPDDPTYKPMFVTLPVLKVGGKSRNGFAWKREDVERVVSQINGDGAEGGLGHTPPDRRATEYKLPVLRWIGARISDDGVAYATAYVPKYSTDVRDFLKEAKRARARVGTSVYGMRGDRGLADMTLESIDIGHPKRLGLPDAAAVPIISQMNDLEAQVTDANDILVAELRQERNTANERITALTTDLTKKDQIVAELQKSADALKLISEMGEFKGKVDVVAAVREALDVLAKFRAEENRRAREKTIAEMVCDKSDLRDRPEYQQLVKLVNANIGDVTDVKAAVAEFMKSDDYKFWSSKVLSELAGPRAFDGGNSGMSREKWLEQMEKSAVAVAREVGVGV